MEADQRERVRTARCTLLSRVSAVLSPVLTPAPESLTPCGLRRRITIPPPRKRRYGFWANVNPDVRHPRWSQAQETFYVDGASNAKRIPTLLYNGYGDEVAYLYGTSREYFYR